MDVVGEPPVALIEESVTYVNHSPSIDRLSLHQTGRELRPKLHFLILPLQSQ